MNIKTLLFPFFLFLFIGESSISFSQTIFCASDSIEKIISANNPDYKKYIDAQNKQINKFIRKVEYAKFSNKKGVNSKLASSNTDSVIYFIPVVVHVIYPSSDSLEGSGANISYDQIISQINALNAAYAKEYPSYNGQNHPNYAAATKIQFCLAGTPAGVTVWTNSSEPGIMRYPIPSNYPDGPIYDTYLNTNAAAFLVKVTHDFPLNPAIFPFENYFNIWVVRSINTLSPSVIGYATFPIANTFPLDGVVIRADCFGDNSSNGNNFPLLPILNQGKVLAHEAGHYLNLRHIFEGGCAGLDSAGSATDPCDLNGDFICDIAPCTTQNISCSVSVPNTCNENYITGTTSNDMIEDYMSYADDDCMNTFTNDQKLRMWATLDLLRNKLWTDQNLVATGVASPTGCLPPLLLADINYPPQICMNQAVQFTTTINSNNTAVSWNWSFPGGNPTTSNSSTPLPVTYQTTGTYNVTLITANAANEKDTNQIQIFITACDLDSSKLSQSNWLLGQYCSMSFSTGIPLINNIARVNQTMFSLEPSACESDAATGNLLFYSNALKIWKVNGATHNEFYLPSTANLGGLLWNTVINMNDTASSLSQIISVPFPGHLGQYYIFIPPIQELGNIGGLKYIIFDSNVSGSLVSENVAPFSPLNLSGKLAEQVTAVPHCNGKDYWIITYAGWDTVFYDKRFYVFLLSENGLTNGTLTAIVPDAYPSNPILKFSPGLYGGGQVKASPDGKHIAIVGYPFYNFALYDFDNSTGAITNEFVLSYITSGQSMGSCSFSSNSKYLYTGISDSTNTYSTIKKFSVQSHLLVDTDTLLQGVGLDRMQLGPDNKIYCLDMNMWHNPKLGTILNPDDSAVSMQYIDNGVDFSSISGCHVNWCLPNFIDAKKPPLMHPNFNYNFQNCNTVNCNFDECWKLYQATWDFGDGTAIITGNNVAHNYSNSGEYKITLTLSAPLMLNPYVVQKTVDILTNPPTITGPEQICVPNINSPWYSVPKINNAVYTWSASGGNVIYSNENTVMVDWQNTGTGNVLVNISYTNCNLNSSLSVFKNPVPVVNAGTDKSVCPGDTVQITAAINSHPVSYIFYWSPPLNISDTSALNPFVYPQASSNYEITVLDSLGCYSQDVVNVTVFDTINATIKLKDSICSLATPFYIDVTPTGGIWTGNGVSQNGYFTPDSITTGVDSLTYTFIDNNGCRSAVSKEVLIVDTIVFTINMVTDSLCPATDPYYLNVEPNDGIWSGRGISSEGYLNPDSLLYGINSFQYIFIDDNGCKSQKIKDIYLSDESCRDSLYPNVIFPNPATDYINISIENPDITQLNLEIFNSLGQIVYKKDVTFPDHKIDLKITTKSFSSGLYIMRLSSDVREWAVKFVIHH